jgi:hypothetical protein
MHRPRVFCSRGENDSNFRATEQSVAISHGYRGKSTSVTPAPSMTSVPSRRLHIVGNSETIKQRQVQR